MRWNFRTSRPCKDGEGDAQRNCVADAIPLRTPAEGIAPSSRLGRAITAPATWTAFAGYVRTSVVRSDRCRNTIEGLCKEPGCCNGETGIGCVARIMFFRRAAARYAMGTSVDRIIHPARCSRYWTRRGQDAGPSIQSFSKRPSEHRDCRFPLVWLPAPDPRWIPCPALRDLSAGLVLR